MRIVFDIDGVIATGTEETVYSEKAGWDYSKCTVIPGMRILLQKLKEEGHYIILHTARWKNDKIQTFNWLKLNNIPFNELHMGKPSADLYVDDRGFKYDNNINKLKEHINALKEKLVKRTPENLIT